MPQRVVLETSIGTIGLQIDTESAERTAANFLQYVDKGPYDGGNFYRTVTVDNQPDDDIRIEVIQGGVGDRFDATSVAPIELERTRDTGLRHLDGVISMARKEPDSATTEFFICIDDQPELDYGGMRNPDGQGFAAFGQVVSGMDVVRAIQRAPHEGQRLEPPVEIVSATRVDE